MHVGRAQVPLSSLTMRSAAHISLAHSSYPAPSIPHSHPLFPSPHQSDRLFAAPQLSFSVHGVSLPSCFGWLIITSYLLDKVSACSSVSHITAATAAVSHPDPSLYASCTLVFWPQSPSLVCAAASSPPDPSSSGWCTSRVLAGVLPAVGNDKRVCVRAGQTRATRRYKRWG